MKLRGWIGKVSAIVMTNVMIFNTASTVYGVETLTDHREFEVVDNNITYSIDLLEYEETTRITVKNDSNKDFSEIVINKTDMVIESTDYTYEGTTILGTDLYDEDEEEFDYSVDEDEAEYNPQGVIYDSAVKEKYKGDYWYAYGKGEKTTKKFLKIGCVAKYRIRTDNLTAVKKIQCDKYTTAIKNCNSSVKSGNGYAASAGLSSSLILGLVIANATFPPTVIVTIVVAAVGGGAAVKNATNAYIDAKGYFNELKSIYETIRDYGTKL